MTSKTIMIGLVALAFVAGSIMTNSAVFAEKDDKGNKGIIEALDAIANAISGIDPNVQVDVPPAEVQIVGVEGPAGSTTSYYLMTSTFPIGPFGIGEGRTFCDAGDQVTGGGWGYIGGANIIESRPYVDSISEISGWYASLENGRTNPPSDLRVWAMCADTALPLHVP